MRVSKNQVTLLAAAVGALFAVGAQAQNVSLSSAGISAISGKTYPVEINNNVPVASAGFTVNTVFGIGTSVNQQRYVKFTLNGATFQSAVTAGSIANTATVGVNTVPTSNLTTTVAFGGAALSNSVIFQITTPQGTNIGDGVQFNIPNGINIASSASNSTITYEVYEFLSDAQSAPSKVLYAQTGTLARFAPSFTFTNFNTTVQPTQVATSISGFRTFNTGATVGGVLSSATSANTAVIGSLSIALASTPPNLLSGTAALSTLADVLANATNSVITIGGDFSAAASNTSVTLAGANANGGAAFTASSVTFNVNATSFGTNNLVRYVVNGTTPVVAGTYSASLSAAPNGTNFRTTTASIANIGGITRDGVTYESPWATATPGFLSRYFLTHTAGSTVSWSAIVRNPSGIVTGGTQSGTIESGKVTQVTLASMLPADLTGISGPFQVTFTIAADASQAQGTYVLTTPSGTVTSTPLYRAALQ